MSDNDDPGARRPYSLNDHLYGVDLAHTHDEDADHDHDAPGSDGPLEDNPIWIQDHVLLLSVGIDIGSSGTQVIFSRINLRRPGEDLSSHGHDHDHHHGHTHDHEHGHDHPHGPKRGGTKRNK